jgi:hypothetical protein
MESFKKVNEAMAKFAASSATAAAAAKNLTDNAKNAGKSLDDIEVV